MKSPEHDTSQQQKFELLTELEAAKRLRISQRQLQRLVELGQGPPRTKLGRRRIAYPLDGLTAWVKERTGTKSE
jgi:predicted DNA-binding transcriptional regulator AlpA